MNLRHIISPSRLHEWAEEFCCNIWNMSHKCEEGRLKWNLQGMWQWWKHSQTIAQRQKLQVPIGRIKGHISPCPYVSTHVTQCISHHSLRQWLFETTLTLPRLIYIHSRHQVNLNLMNYISDFHLKLKVRSSKSLIIFSPLTDTLSTV